MKMQLEETMVARARARGENSNRPVRTARSSAKQAARAVSQMLRPRPRPKAEKPKFISPRMIPLYTRMNQAEA